MKTPKPPSQTKAPPETEAKPDAPIPVPTPAKSSARDAASSEPAKAMGVIEIKPPRPGPRAVPNEPVAYPAAEPDAETQEELAEKVGSARGVSAVEIWRDLPPGVRLPVLRTIRWTNRYRVRIAWGFVLAACGVVGVGLFAMTLADSEPRWWSGASLRSIEMAELARRVENGAITHITADHQGATTEAVEWPVKLSDDGANAWLNLRLPVWLPRMTAEEFEDVYDARGALVERAPVGGVRWPESVDEVRVAFVDGRFRIGARVRTGDRRTRVFGATLAPEVRGDGSLWMRATSVSVGRLGLPARLVLGRDGGRLREHLPVSLVDSAEGEAIFTKLAGDAPMFEDAVIRLGDGRRVRLLSLDVQNDSLVAWFRTE
ncbi:MAG: hypothetical protein AAFR76_04935 [Planctomycetota bacterium]